MTITPKIIIPVGIAVIVAIILFIWGGQTKLIPSTTPTPTNNVNTSGGQEQVTSPSSTTNQVKGTDSAEVVVSELLEIAAAEQSLFNEETTDSNLITSDNTELNSLLNAYDAGQY